MAEMVRLRYINKDRSLTVPAAHGWRVPPACDHETTPEEAAYLTSVWPQFYQLDVEEPKPAPKLRSWASARPQQSTTTASTAKMITPTEPKKADT